jgi:predicted HTH domain antitoxin
MTMKVSLEQAASILGTSPDEVMLLVQSQKITAGVDSDSLSWNFELDQLLSLKTQLDEGVQSDPQFLAE